MESVIRTISELIQGAVSMRSRQGNTECL